MAFYASEVHVREPFDARIFAGDLSSGYTLCRLLATPYRVSTTQIVCVDDQLPGVGAGNRKDFYKISNPPDPFAP